MSALRGFVDTTSDEFILRPRLICGNCGALWKRGNEKYAGRRLEKTALMPPGDLKLFFFFRSVIGMRYPGTCPHHELGDLNSMCMEPLCPCLFPPPPFPPPLGIEGATGWNLQAAQGFIQ